MITPMHAMRRIISSLVPLAFLCSASAQGTVTFDGPPLIPSGANYVVQSYTEAGVWFLPIPGTDGFIRQGSNPTPAYWPDNGTGYLLASVGDSLMFGLDNGGEFSLFSVDLAEWNTVYPQPVSVSFIGYKADGSTVITNLITDGVIDGTGPVADFQTMFFGPEFAGLSRVEVPTHGWSMDNLVVTIPEPSTGALAVVGAAVFSFRLLRRTRRSP